MTGCLKGGLLRWMACQNPHPLIDPSRPLEGEVVLRETLSHRPDFCALRTALMRLGVAMVFDFTIRLVWLCVF